MPMLAGYKVGRVKTYFEGFLLIKSDKLLIT